MAILGGGLLSLIIWFYSMDCFLVLVDWMGHYDYRFAFYHYILYKSFYTII